MADITHGRWIERKGVGDHRSFQTIRTNSSISRQSEKEQAIHPSTIFFGIMLSTLIAPAGILAWAIFHGGSNLIN
ncbi:hypothetical protein ACLBWZ_02490 [Brucellaceae bacterium C25G]